VKEFQTAAAIEKVIPARMIKTVPGDGIFERLSACHAELSN
jgi:hypothetical protein